MSLGVVARSLHMSERTLRRGLVKEGTTYRELLDRLRPCGGYRGSGRQPRLCRVLDPVASRPRSTESEGEAQPE